MSDRFLEIGLTEDSLFFEKDCICCDEKLDSTEEEVFLCSKCHRPGHKDCWEEIEKCPHCECKVNLPVEKEEVPAEDIDIIFSTGAGKIKTEVKDTEETAGGEAEEAGEEEITKLDIKRFLKENIIQIVITAILFTGLIFFIYNAIESKALTIHKDKGLECYEKGLFPEAADEFDAYLKQTPDDVEGLSYMALSLLKEGKAEEAFSYADKAFKINSSSSLANFALGSVYCAQGDKIEGKSRLIRAVELEPNLIEAHQMLGEIFYSKQELDKAEIYFENILKIDPYNVAAINSLGVIYYEKGELEKAAEIFLQVIEVEPDNGDGWLNMGNIYYEKENYDKALEYYLKAQTLSSDNPAVYNQLGLIYYKSGEFDEALEQFKAALKLSPDYISAYNNMALVYYEEKKIDRAVEQFKKVLDLSPDDVEANTYMGIIYYGKQDYDNGAKYLKKALKEEPNYVPANLAMAKLYYKLAEWDKSLEYYKNTLDLSPNHDDRVSIYNRMGDCYYHTKKWDKAMEYYNMVLKADKKNAVVMRQVGLVYEAKEDYEKAIQIYESALEINPDYKALNEDLDRAYGKLYYW